MLPESLAPGRRAPFDLKRANPFGALVLLRSHVRLATLATAGFLSNLAHASLPSISVLYMQYRYGFDERMVGFTLAGGVVGHSGLVTSVAPELGRDARAVGVRQYDGGALDHST